MGDGGTWSPSSLDEERRTGSSSFNIEKSSSSGTKGDGRLLHRSMSGSLSGLGEDSRHAGFGNSGAGYAAIDEEAYRAAARSRCRWNAFIFAIIFALATILCLAIVIPVLRKKGQHGNQPSSPPPPDFSNAIRNQRTAFHFQPKEHWMNDPNGPMYYKEWFHLFFQYNPGNEVWGNISWGHAVSKDLIHWSYLPIALKPDKWYDQKGIWSGSATLRDDGTPVLLYTGWTNASEQVQNMAVPANASDPLLRDWVKSDKNPIARAPSPISPKDFRDPTTAWKTAKGSWQMLVGARDNSSGADVGLALLYESDDFEVWREVGPIYKVAGAGMWEMPDLYPVSRTATVGVAWPSDGSTNNDLRHVFKVSAKGNRDLYAIGTFDVSTSSWRPEQASLDIGKGYLYDYGKYYASKAFFDPRESRRILMGWVAEADTALDDVTKGWASVQAIPRTVSVDEHFASRLVQSPVEELKLLRTATPATRSTMALDAGAFISITEAKGVQLDIEVVFHVPPRAAREEGLAANYRKANPSYTIGCHPKGLTGGGVVGPFGIGVLVGSEAGDMVVKEMTSIYFEMAFSSRDAMWHARVCSDLTRSSTAPEVNKGVYSSVVDMATNESELSLRVVVDHSIVEAFAQNGRACITSRAYPRLAIGDKGRVVIFNNGVVPVLMKTLSVWPMSSVVIDDL